MKHWPRWRDHRGQKACTSALIRKQALRSHLEWWLYYFLICFVNRLGDAIDHEIRLSTGLTTVGIARTENPRVCGSMPPLATIRIKVLVNNDTWM